MTYVEGDLVKEKGKQTGTFRVHKIEGDGKSLTCYGGKRWSWRTLAIDTLRIADKKEARMFLRAEEVLKEALPKATTRKKGSR